MKRFMVFAAASLVFLGLLAGPAAAAGGLKRFNIDDIQLTYSGNGTVTGILQCNPSVGGPTGYDITITVNQGSTQAFGLSGAPCSGQIEHWGTWLDQSGPIFPGKAKVCANAAKHYETFSSTSKASSAICQLVKFVEAS